MPLNAGTNAASDGLAKAIFDNLKVELGPALEASGADMTEVNAGWAKLSYAIAKGVVDHLVANMEIKNIHVNISSGAQDGTTTGHVS